MQTYNFTVWLEGVSELSDELLDRLFEAGCDDTLPVKSGNDVFLEFDRDAESLQKAVVSALRDISKAGVTVRRIGKYELVSAAEIARRTGRTRASVSQLIKGDRGARDFPTPEIGGMSPRWRWSDVQEWLAKHEGSVQ